MTVLAIPLVLTVLLLGTGLLAFVIAGVVYKPTRPFVVGGFLLVAIAFAGIFTVRVSSDRQVQHSAPAHRLQDQARAIQANAPQLGSPTLSPAVASGTNVTWSHSPTLSQMKPIGGSSIGWARLTMVLVGVALLYGLMRLLNRPDGSLRPIVVMGGLGGLAASVAVVAWYLSLAGHQISPSIQPPMAAGMSEEWDHATRPRIDLSQRYIPTRTTRSTSTNSLQVSFSEAGHGAVTFGIANSITNQEAAKVLLSRLPGMSSTEMQVSYGDQTITLGQDASLPTILKSLDEIRGKDPTFIILANGREVSINTNQSLSDSLSEIRRIFQKDGNELRLRCGKRILSQRGGLSYESVVSFLKSIASQKRTNSPEVQQLKLAELPPSEIIVMANGKEMTVRSDQPLEEALKQIQKQFIADDRSIDLDFGNAGTLTYSGRMSLARIGDQLHRAFEFASPAATIQETDPSSKEAPPHPKRPDWIDQPSKRIGKVYRQVVKTGPYGTAEECYATLGLKLMDEANRYAHDQSIAGQHPVSLPALGITYQTLLQEICVDEFMETFYSDAVGAEMKRLYVQVEFDQAFRDRLVRLNHAHQRQQTITSFSFLGVSLLVLIGSVFFVLKMDEATKGFYTKRLFIGVPLAIIGLILAITTLFA